jgi:pimeloyl-ACP methyl ester carboxylesterase
MPTVRANGIDVHFEVEGSGPPLVLLHGASSASADDWAAQVALLGPEFAVHLVDLRGHAGTRWTEPGVVGFETLVDDLRGFADALGLRAFHLAGFSLGGMTALTFAARYPERVASLVLVGVTIEREPRASVARVLLDPDRIEREEPAWVAELERRHDPVQGPGGWRRLLAALMGEVGAELPVTLPELRRILAPALIAVGDRDPFVPVPQAVALFRQLPDARLLVVPDGGHRAMFNRPDVVNPALFAFWRSALVQDGPASQLRNP